MSTKNHNCIKCGVSYTSNEVDPYYCTACEKEKNKIAEEVNKKIGSRPKKKTKSDWQMLKEQGQITASPNGSRIFLLNRHGK